MEQKKCENESNRLEWAKPQIKILGKAEELIMGGGGKLTPVTGDSGDNRKPPGQEPK